LDEHERAAKAELAGKGDADALQRLIVEYHAPVYTTVAAAIEPVMFIGRCLAGDGD
jgi:hypothetical protein